MSEKKSDPYRKVEEDKNIFSSFDETLLTSGDSRTTDQASTAAGSEKESCPPILKDTSAATVEEQVPKTESNQVESPSSKKIKPNTLAVSNREIDEEARTSFSDADSEQTGSRTSLKDELDMIKDKSRRNVGDILSEASERTSSSSSSSSEDETDPEERAFEDASRDLCELCLKYLNIFGSDSGGDSDAKNKGEKCLTDCHKTQIFHDAVEELNKLKSKSNLTAVKKYVSASKISDLRKFHVKERNILEIPRFRRSFSAPQGINSVNETRYSENIFSKTLSSHDTKSLPCSAEGKTRDKAFDKSVSKESIFGTSDNKIQKDTFKRLRICRRCLKHFPSAEYAQTAQGTSLSEKSSVDIKDRSPLADSKNNPPPFFESVESDLSFSKTHFTEKKQENKSTVENPETISAAHTVGSDSESKELDKTKHELDKSGASSDDKTKQKSPQESSESSPAIFKIPFLRRPKKLAKVGSPKQSSSTPGTPTGVENVTPEKKIERPKDLRGKPRSAYYAFSPGSPSGFEMRPYHSLPNIHMPPRKTNVHKKISADQIKTAVRALFRGPPDPRTPTCRESHVTEEIKALVESMKVPESGGQYSSSKKSLRGRIPGSSSESDLSKFKSCRKLNFDTPEKEQTNTNRTFQGHSSVDLTGGMAYLERHYLIPSSSGECMESDATLQKKELSEPSTSGVFPSASTTEKLAPIDPEKSENFSKVPESALNEEQSQNYLSPSGSIVSVSPSKRKAEALECDSSNISIQDRTFNEISDESLSVRPVKKGKLSDEMKCEEDFADVLIKESSPSDMVQLSPDMKLEKNLKDSTSPLKRKAEDLDTESASCSFKESVQTEIHKQTSKRTKFTERSAWRDSGVSSDDDDDDDNSKIIE